MPGKVLRAFSGRPLLGWVVARAELLQRPIVIATSDQADDDPIADLANALGVACFRGSLDDVLGRAQALAQHFGLRHIARLCADRPYFDTEQMQMAIALAEAEPQLDLVSNQLSPAVPRGLTTEVISATALSRAEAAATLAHQREHLTAYLYAHPEQFRMRSLPNPLAAYGDPNYGQPNHVSSNGGFAVDTLADWERLSRLADGDPLVATRVIAERMRDAAAAAGAAAHG